MLLWQLGLGACYAFLWSDRARPSGSACDRSRRYLLIRNVRYFGITGLKIYKHEKKAELELFKSAM